MPEDLFSGPGENASPSRPETAGLLHPAAGTAGRERNPLRRGPFSCSSSHPESARSPAAPPFFFPLGNGGHVGIDSISAHSRSTGRGTNSSRFSGMNDRCSRYSIISNKARHLLLLSLMFNLLPNS
ncbi:hypothetical protein DMI80_11910 [Akkermansia muciniphila]|nr:hypothetical protein CXT89_07580 [Akkermansia muciniphila]QHV66542.1 hypothetical protein DMI78_11895 [Akkermansia muciniphila]QHV71457.1 hypothetical protein DMI80_11910 [Akkermansia muciniphila]QHV73911.1 hypothetical protein DMI81_11910 [Akkermansia muciniphila]